MQNNESTSHIIQSSAALLEIVSKENSSTTSKDIELTAFHTSALLSLHRTALINRLEEIDKLQKIKYDTDEDFVRFTSARCHSAPSWLIYAYFGLWIVLYILFCYLLLITRIAKDEGTLYLVGLILSLTTTFVCRHFVHKYFDQKDKNEVNELLLVHQKKRHEHNENLKNITVEKEELEEKLIGITDALHSLVPHGGVHPDHWDYAYELWRMVENHSARSLKEALNRYDDIQWRNKMTLIAQQTGKSIDSLHHRINNLAKQQEALSASLALHKLNDSIDDLLTTSILLNKWRE